MVKAALQATKFQEQLWSTVCLLRLARGAGDALGARTFRRDVDWFGPARPGDPKSGRLPLIMCNTKPIQRAELLNTVVRSNGLSGHRCQVSSDRNAECVELAAECIDNG